MFQKKKYESIVFWFSQVYYKGFHGDCTETFHIGTVNDKGRRLVKTARHLLKVAIAFCRPGVRFKDLGNPSSRLIYLGEKVILQ